MMPGIGLAEHRLRGVAELLNRRLADEYVLATKTRRYHWHVAGPTFAQLHRFFHDQHVDEVAGRIRALGQPALGTLAEFAKWSRLEEDPDDHPDTPTMIANLLADHQTIIRQLREELTASTRVCATSAPPTS